MSTNAPLVPRPVAPQSKVLPTGIKPLVSSTSMHAGLFSDLLLSEQMRAGRVMVKRGSILYVHPPNTSINTLEDGLDLRITVIKTDTARIRFTNDQGENQLVPDDFTITKMGSDDAENVFEDQIFISWLHGYVVQFRDLTFRIERQV